MNSTAKTNLNVWVGPDFSADGNGILIVSDTGESKIPPLELYMQAWIANRLHDSVLRRLFQILSEMRDRESTPEQRASFWNTVAFYSIAEPQIEREFRELLSVLKPRGVLAFAGYNAELVASVTRELNVPCVVRPQSIRRLSNWDVTAACIELTNQVNGTTKAVPPRPVRRELANTKERGRRRTKWTPKRFCLLFAVFLSLFAGLCLLPWGLILPFFAFGSWITAWQDPTYGYNKDGTLDWSDWNPFDGRLKR